LTSVFLLNIFAILIVVLRIKKFYSNFGFKKTREHWQLRQRQLELLDEN
jgi:hypothetical protein